MARSYRFGISPLVRLACVGPLALLVIFVASGLAAGSDASRKEADSTQPPQFLERLRESRAPYHTFATRFVQHKRLAILDIVLESEGMIFFRRPRSVRYEMISPVRSLMIYDGKKVRCYAFSEDKWNLLNNPGATAIGQVLRQIGRWIQGDFDADRKMFEIKAVPAEDGGGSIHLIPRSKTLAEYIQRVEIHVKKVGDNYRVAQVIIRESDVDLTDMRFHQELHNQPIPEGTFTSPEASSACQSVFPQEDHSDPNEAEKPKS